MPSESLVLVANLLQSAVPFLSLAAYIPQWRRIIVRKSSQDVSLFAWMLWGLTSSIAVFYAVVQFLLTQRGLALIFSSSLNFLFVLMTVFLVRFYRG